MSYIEESFYEQDQEEYNLENNKEFSKWLITSIESGTRCDRYIKLKNMQDLIDELCNLYIVKYPDFKLEEIPHNPYGEMIRELNEPEINLSVKGMILRLSWQTMDLMLCEYGIDGNSSGNYSEIENGRLVNKSWVGLDLYDKRNTRKNYSISFDPKTGIIIDSKIKGYINHSLEAVLNHLIKTQSNLDYHELLQVVKTNHFEVELRHRLLQLTALKILYTGKTPKIGYERANKFIEEMNDELGLLLSEKEIEQAYQNYLENKEKGFIKKKKFKNN